MLVDWRELGIQNKHHHLLLCRQDLNLFRVVILMSVCLKNYKKISYRTEKFTQQGTEPTLPKNIPLFLFKTEIKTLVSKKSHIVFSLIFLGSEGGGV